MGQPIRAVAGVEWDVLFYFQQIRRNALRVLRPTRLLLAHGDDGRYQVRVAADGHLQWVTGKPGEEERFDHEPDASPLLKLTLRLLAPFAPEQML